MHARQRNGLGNGYRPNSFGFGGMPAASRISPDGSMRGQRTYNNQYRNNIRGAYGRGHSKQSQLLPPQETDIFVEAGRLAAEYLVSKGLLPPNSLSGKWMPDGVKNEMNNFQGFRQHGPDKTQNPADGRASVHSRLGKAVPETAPSRRRHSDEYNAMGSKISVRGRKRTGSFKYGSEMNRELGRSGSWGEKSGGSPALGAGSDASVSHLAEPPEDIDGFGEGQSLSTGEVNDSDLDNEKNLPSGADGETIKRPDDENTFDDEADVAKGGNESKLQSKHDESKVINESKSQLKHGESKDDALVSEDHLDLAKQCKFVYVPTKARTSLTKKVAKGDQKPVSEVDKISSREESESSGAQLMDVDNGNSTCSDSSQQNHQLILEPNVLSAPTIEKELDITCSTKTALCVEAGSLPEISGCNEKESGEGPCGLRSPNSMFRESNEKRVLDHKSDDREDVKKIRQWVPSVDDQSDDSLPLSSLMKIQQPSLEPRPSSSDLVTLSADQKGSGMSLLPKSQTDSCKFMQVKQLFPGSFKTCDLNLSGTCDANDSNEVDPMLILPYVTQPGKVGGPVDIDFLSMSNSDKLPDKNCKLGSKNSDIEVIDLENDSAQEQETFSNPERRADTLFPDLEGFSNNMHNDNGVPDTQDGYGLMISELLGNGSPNCSSVPPDLNSLQNHMDIAGTEGMLGDDESIYMSLGEIPISLLGPWEQPTHDYGKPF